MAALVSPDSDLRSHGVRPARNVMPRAAGDKHHDAATTGPQMKAVSHSSEVRRKAGFNELFWQVTRFLVVGVANTVVGLGTIILAIKVFGLGDVAANMFGYAVGLALGFVLNRSWTFRAIDPRPMRAMIGYFAAFAVSYALNLLVVLAVLEGGADRVLAQACGMPVYTGSFFLLCRFMVFRHVRNVSAT